MARTISEIAAEIRKDWYPVSYAAQPYLDAMRHVSILSDRFGEDPADIIVAYFLSNATGWRGETARRVKKELNAMLKAARR